MEEKDTLGMPDMMPKGTVDNPPQSEPQNIPNRMEDQPYQSPENTDNQDKHDGRDEMPDEHTREMPPMPDKPRPDQDIRDHSDC